MFMISINNDNKVISCCVQYRFIEIHSNIEFLQHLIVSYSTIDNCI